MAQEVTHPEVTVKLTGEDGNAFAIIGRVAREISSTYGAPVGKAFAHAAMDCGSYDELLAFVQRTVHVR